MQGRLEFIQPDLMVLFKNMTLKTLKKSDSPYYYILILLKGSCNIIYKNVIHHLKSGEIHIAHNNEDFYYDFNDTHAEIIEIYFNSSLLRNYDENYDLLEPFYDYKHLKLLTKKGNAYEFKASIDALLKALETRSSRAFVLTPFLQLICEINYLYEESHPSEIKETDSNYAKIISYIDNHIYEKITLEKVSKSVFLSSKCICNNIKKYSGMTFLQLISSRRSNQAKHLIYSSNMSLQAIAQLCGFDTYSTFYRVYKRQFGITPKEELERKANGHKAK